MTFYDGSKPYGQWVKEQRERLGLSQVELAKRAGISLAQIYNIETGRSKNPQTKTRQRLARVLVVNDEQTCPPVVAFPNSPKNAPQENDGELSCSFCHRPLARAGAIAWLSDDRDPTACERCVDELNSIFARTARHERNDGKAALRLVQKSKQ